MQAFWAEFVPRAILTTDNNSLNPLMFTVRPLMFAIHIEEDERNLAERLKRREPAAMAELYDRYGALVQTQADGERLGSAWLYEK